ncbi:Asp-tRNA(Asn)/Glu-tRNA(Gln) amidotransferase subunit GatB [Telmatospirillum sp.]|uniref:Asp-tRNA(Asn)/Glu-tRNA(Gln) amidotransferase subunit GatB n=1 Tax=Telmatospirillum sp. TaxID=2079197 RepID=UPI0028489548|nr:Asp-tRNA(Asn)/Glu-tRNA(Gln) amidotransferase subunit GatB [Telmatospirillum sp.]MDR3441337.1 Asp-tRNA(Asn)/Glu-tRNA(Gln) amidotransferase subunit GatB [Telmatospirillum sp.]
MSYVIEGETGDWELVIGLEVHAQVISKSKLFSGAATDFGAEPNTQVSLVDAAMPGMLPVINEYCIEQGVRTGLGLKAKINLTSVFARKNYFYADLPQGYQISQYEYPIVGEGEVILDMPDGSTRTVGIERLHLEQDAGKSLHDQHPSKSFIDLNRSGVALMEIVSKPDMRSPEEAAAYITKLRSILRYLGSCDGNMAEGSMRCDVNVSVRKAGEPYRTRAEIKNVNSIRFVHQAIEYEARRQVDLYEEGGQVVQETRLFDANKGETRSMRSKEHAHDYRYFPDPDLLPLNLTQDYVDAIKATLPELPDEKKERFIRDYHLSAYDAGLLVADQATADFFESVAKGRDPKMACNWVMGDFSAAMNRLGRTIDNPPVSAANLGGLIDLIADDTISGRLAKEVFELMVETGKAPAVIVDEKGLRQVTDTGAIEASIDAVLAANGDKVEQYRSGKDKLFGFFVGQVMKATGGKANPALVNEILKKKLG